MHFHQFFYLEHPTQPAKKDTVSPIAIEIFLTVLLDFPRYPFTDLLLELQMFLGSAHHRWKTANILWLRVCYGFHVRDLTP